LGLSGQAGRFLRLITVHDEILPDKEDYRQAADIRAALKLSGRPIGKADPLIAACAYRRGCVMVSGNIGHHRFIVEAGFPLTLENCREV